MQIPLNIRTMRASRIFHQDFAANHTVLDWLHGPACSKRRWPGEISGLARIFHQDADYGGGLGETDRARPAQPIDHSIGKTGMPDMAGQNPPETAEPKADLYANQTALDWLHRRTCAQTGVA